MLGKGTHTAVGITKLCEALKGSAVTSLKCAAAPSFCFVSAPVDTFTHPIPALPLARSLLGNYIGDKGATALAAILNKTKITHLKCAAAPKRLSMPTDTFANAFSFFASLHVPPPRQKASAFLPWPLQNRACSQIHT